MDKAGDEELEGRGVIEDVATVVVMEPIVRPVVEGTDIVVDVSTGTGSPTNCTSLQPVAGVLSYTTKACSVAVTQKEAKPNDKTPSSKLQKKGLTGGSTNSCSAAVPSLELVPT